MRSDLYQYALIFLGVIATLFFGAFLYREIYPEYRIYQEDYIALEKFRSTYTGEPPPEFQLGIKQIVFEREDKGPAAIDRCISCHVALQIPAFSPTKIARDLNGIIVLDEQGIPVKVPNEEYVWGKLDAKIAALEKEQPAEAEQLRKLKLARVGEHVYDATKVLQMHPLIGRETRPFEYHSLEEYGCTVCHNGNGRGLTTEKAHGPVFDGEYEIESIGPEPEFTEPDQKNDPQFSRAYNQKPGHNILFQTTPLYIGSLIQAKCVQCHQTSASTLLGAVQKTELVAERRKKKMDAVKTALSNQTQSLVALLKLKKSLQEVGFDATLKNFEDSAIDYSRPSQELYAIASQVQFLKNREVNQKELPQDINRSIEEMLGSPGLAHKLEKSASLKDSDIQKTVDRFLVEHHNEPDATGSLFKKYQIVAFEQEFEQHVENSETSFSQLFQDQSNISALQSDMDDLTREFQQGQHLYLSQACYACHRIAGFSRGGVGPELTREGNTYPWYVKKKMVWPQFDLRSSTMPNMHIDHEELEGLMTFVMAQQGPSHAVSANNYRTMIQEWEAGKKLPWEEPIPPNKIHDLRYSMTVFATEGCAACHRLKGFESDVGYRVEIDPKDKSDFETRYKETEWFENLIPEMILGSELVTLLESHQKEIDQHIVDHVREGSLLEEIEKLHPGTIESYYTPFKYAARAKNADYAALAAAEKDPVKQAQIWEELKEWKSRVHRVLMIFIQEYGLGRLIGPRPNWSGIYRSDEWLMEHFHKPTGHIPNSIMPVLPFDDTKFYSLTYMLDILGKRNRDSVRAIWENRGFNPEQAYEIHCSQCHGAYRNGNGPVAQWIYPIPKSLRNADFLRNLTKERAIASIQHGVKGTPMPPWGENAPDKTTGNDIPVLNDSEIARLANWLFSTIPGASVIKGYEDVPKWNYSPEDVIKELHQEGNELKSVFLEPENMRYFAALQPTVNMNTRDSGDTIFEKRSAPVPGGPDAYGYYIKKKYYTDANIASGKAFFELNCAVCHGPEGDGKGVRAEVMQDAKPRMLTNLDWSDTRDDLRLLRSIKYGVPGTAMTPWGDLTSSLQRLQLVIFIRSLSEEQKKTEHLQSYLYQAFNTTDMSLEAARVVGYELLDRVQQDYQKGQRFQEQLVKNMKVSDEEKDKEALENYQKLLKLQTQLEQLQDLDQTLVKLKNEVGKEGDLYKSIGLNLLIKPLSPESISNFNKIISSNEGRFRNKEGQLFLQSKAEKEEEAIRLQKQIIAEIESKIEILVKQKSVLEGKIASPGSNEELNTLIADLTWYQNLKNKVISDFEEINRNRVKQKLLYESYKKKIDNEI